MQPIPCPYWDAIPDARPGTLASCGLLRQITGLTESPWCLVRRDACEACCRCAPPSAEALNPVVASLLLDVARRALGCGGVPGCG
jgi:hypothetical protein